jgi:hypothetical protein
MMFRLMRIQWAALRALEDAERALGLEGPIHANDILNISAVDPGELSIEQASKIYRERTVRDAVVMILIHVGSFWLHHSLLAKDAALKQRAKQYHRIAIGAATRLSVLEHAKELNHCELIQQMVQKSFEENRRMRELV